MSITTLERSAFIVLLLAAGTMLSLSAFGKGSSGAVSDPADLSVSKSDNPDPVTTDAVLTYAIDVANAGPDLATNVTLTDDLPGGVEFLTASATAGTCARQGGRVVCELGTIASDSTVTATIQVRVKKKKGTMSNSASVTSDVADPNAANDSDTETTTIGGAATVSAAARGTTFWRGARAATAATAARVATPSEAASRSRGYAAATGSRAASRRSRASSPAARSGVIERSSAVSSTSLIVCSIPSASSRACSSE